MLADGGGLYLQVASSSARSWIWRYMRHGKSRQMGLGSLADVSLQQAREARDFWRRKLRVEGVDPIDTRNAEMASLRLDQNKMSFQKAAEQYISAHCETWRNPKHRAQWTSTLETYVYPMIGKRPAHLIEETEVLSVLRPIWSAKPETASRIRGRIEVILEQLEVRKLRKGENPAQWRGNLDTALPAPRKVRQVRHHAAMPFDGTPRFMATLRIEGGIAALALELTVLCASRTTEVIGAKWTEFDLDKKVWTVPATRMKSGKEHRVPLSAASMAILNKLCERRVPGDEFVFPGRRRAQPMSNMAMAKVLERLGAGAFTVHGFRSTFRDWAAERTEFSREVVEMALAHAIGSEVEAAYRRGDLFEKRRRLMDAWSEFLFAEAHPGKVVPIRTRA